MSGNSVGYFDGDQLFSCRGFTNLSMLSPTILNPYHCFGELLLMNPSRMGDTISCCSSSSMAKLTSEKGGGEMEQRG